MSHGDSLSDNNVVKCTRVPNKNGCVSKAAQLSIKYFSPESRWVLGRVCKYGVPHLPNTGAGN